jgi:hypothetical protein
MIPEIEEEILLFLPSNSLVFASLISLDFHSLIHTNRIKPILLLLKYRQNMLSKREQFIWAIEKSYYLSWNSSLRCSSDLDILRWLHSTFNLTEKDMRIKDNYALRCSAENGRLEVLKWLYFTFNLTVEDVKTWDNCALRHAAQNGYLKVCQWLYSTFNLTVKDVRSCDNYILRYAISNGHLDIIEWLDSTFGITRKDITYTY